MATDTKLTEQEFCDRFVAEMLRLAGNDSDTEKHARETAPSYYEEQYQRDDASPEECAATDISYWEV